MTINRFALVAMPLIAFCLIRAQVAQAQTSSNRSNPFEAVPKPAEPAAPKVSGPIIEAIEFRGTTRNAQSALRAVLTSRVGGTYDTETLRRDVQALYATTRFSRIVSETEPGRAGVIVRLLLVERPLIQSVEYQGDDTVTVGAILDRLSNARSNLGLRLSFTRTSLGGQRLQSRNLWLKEDSETSRSFQWWNRLGCPHP
jgi:outer membrane protein assembly factor BamA